MDAADVQSDLVEVLFTERQIQERIGELAREIEADYDTRDILLVGILRGAVMVMADLARAFSRHVEMDWMAVSSYGSGTKTSGVVRILKDLDSDVSGRHVIIVDEIIDTGLTLSDRATRRAWRSAPCCANLRRSGCPSRSSTSAGTSPTSSSSGTAWTTASGTGTCVTSAPSRPACTRRGH